MQKLNKKDSKLWILGLVILGVAAITIVYRIVDNPNTITYHKPLPDQHNLFTARAKGLLNFVTALKEKNSQPSSVYIFDGKYTINIFKAVLLSNLDLEKVVYFENKHSTNINGFYHSGGNPDFTIKYGEDRKDVLSRLQVRYQGGLINQYFEKDSLYYAYLKFDNYSLAYDNKDSFLRAEKKNWQRFSSSLDHHRKKEWIYVYR